METVQFQSYVFSYSVYGGIIIGIFYDIYRVVRGRKRSERLITSLWDVVFLMSVFIVVVWSIFSSSYGDIRAYVFIGFLVGFYFYEKLLGKTAAGIFHFVCRGATSFLRRTGCILAFPIKLLLSFVRRCGNGIAHMLGRVIMRLRKRRRLPKKLVYDLKKNYELIIKRKKINH